MFSIPTNSYNGYVKYFYHPHLINKEHETGKIYNLLMINQIMYGIGVSFYCTE